MIEDLIAQFKNLETVVPIPKTLSPKLVAVLGAWPTTSVRRNQIARRPPAGGGESALWTFLWEGISVDIRDLAEISGLSIQAAQGAFAEARDRRLIYPDGTINSRLKIP